MMNRCVSGSTICQTCRQGSGLCLDGIAAFPQRSAVTPTSPVSEVARMCCCLRTTAADALGVTQQLCKGC